MTVCIDTKMVNLLNSTWAQRPWVPQRQNLSIHQEIYPVLMKKFFTTSREAAPRKNLPTKNMCCQAQQQQDNSSQLACSLNRTKKSTQL